jgi:hypothetical protein
MTAVGEIQQCNEPNLSTGRRCIYVWGHSGEHFMPDDGQDHSDEIRYRHVADERDRFKAEIDRLRSDFAFHLAWFAGQEERSDGDTQPVATTAYNHLVRLANGAMARGAVRLIHDETERDRLRAENAALRAQRDRLLRVLDDIYPALVSGVTALKAVRATVALADWERMARLVADATREAR